MRMTNFICHKSSWPVRSNIYFIRMINTRTIFNISSEFSRYPFQKCQTFIRENSASLFYVTTTLSTCTYCQMMIVLPLAFSLLNCRPCASKVIRNNVSLGTEIWQMLRTVILIRKVVIKLSILNAVDRKKRLTIHVKLCA